MKTEQVAKEEKAKEEAFIAWCFAFAIFISSQGTMLLLKHYGWRDMSWELCFKPTEFYICWLIVPYFCLKLLCKCLADCIIYVIKDEKPK